MSLTILLVDDDKNQCFKLQQMVEKLGHRALIAENGDIALKLLEQNQSSIHLVVLDLVMPERDGLSVLEEMKKRNLDQHVVVQANHSGLDSVDLALKAGAFDFFIKPVSTERFSVVITNALQLSALKREIRLHRDFEENTLRLNMLIAHAPAMKECLALAERHADTQAPLMLSGEAGTGKDVLARAIHGSSKRATKPFDRFDCSSWAMDEANDILFGDAFSMGMIKSKFHNARNGTLMLDNIEALPLPAQMRLLHILEGEASNDPEIQRLVKLNVRIIAVTEVDLAEAVRDGRFREDLYYRLSVYPIRLPALRNRIEDIADLARHFIARFAAKDRRPVNKITLDAVKILSRSQWPGNVRQMENTIHRAILLCDEAQLDAQHIETALGMIDQNTLSDNLEHRSSNQIAMHPHASSQMQTGFLAQTDLAQTSSHSVSICTREEDPTSPYIGRAADASTAAGHSPDAVQDPQSLLRLISADGSLRPFNDIERDILALAVDHCNGNLSRAAKSLRLGRSTLYRKLQDAC